MELKVSQARSIAVNSTMWLIVRAQCVGLTHILRTHYNLLASWAAAKSTILHELGYPGRRLLDSLNAEVRYCLGHVVL